MFFLRSFFSNKTILILLFVSNYKSILVDFSLKRFILIVRLLIDRVAIISQRDLFSMKMF